MLYVVCISGLHKEISDSIRDNVKDKKVVLVYLPKGLGIFRDILNIPIFIFWWIFSMLDPRAHIVIPHIFNPWFSLMASFSKELSFYDDGIMYYFDSITIKNLACRIYLLLCWRVNPNFKTSMLGRERYIDYLKSSNGKLFFCLYPDLIGNLNIRKIRITIRKNDNSNNEMAFPIYLDTSDDIADWIGFERLMEYLKALADEHGLILFKEHPRHISKVSGELRKKAWAKEVVGNYEEFIRESSVKIVVSIYSSALISTKQICPEAKLICITNDLAEREFGSLHEIYENLGVVFKNI